MQIVIRKIRSFVRICLQKVVRDSVPIIDRYSQIGQKIELTRRWLKSDWTQMEDAIKPVVEPHARDWLRGDLSFSAAGEDRFVLSWLERGYGLDIRNVRYLDIGANHPFNLSNTFVLYHRGASGVLVEPDPSLCSELKRERPRDIVLNVGAAFDDLRSARLTRFSSSVFNTFSANQAEYLVDDSKNWHPSQRQEILDSVEVTLVPANDLIEAHFPQGIDFISIDAEGVDFQILQSINLQRFKPKMICVEASRRPQTDFDSLLEPFGYRLLARSVDNLIYAINS